MEKFSNEFRVDKEQILIGNFNKSQIKPEKTIVYSRNNSGTLVVNSNDQNINSQRLVINLIGTKFKLNSFENVLKTDFEEFIEEIPDIEPNTTQEAVQDLSGQVNDLENQIRAKNLAIDNLNSTIEELNKQLSMVNSGSAAAAIDVSGAISAALNDALKPDDTKPRIFSDGTLLRDRDNFSFFYIMENGRKRFFNFNEELLNITAKAIGRVKPSGTGQPIPDLLDVSQDVLDDIPSGAPFTNFDLVKNKPTDAPAPVDLEGKPLIAKWVYPNNGIGKTPDNPIVINVVNFNPTNDELRVPLQLQFATAEGIVNRVEIWDLTYNTTWFDGKLSLPIKDINNSDNDYKQFKVAGRQQYTDQIQVILKDTTEKISSGTAGNGLNYVNRFKPIQLSIQNPNFNLALTPKIFNDNDDELHDLGEVMYISVRYTPKMPNLINLPVPDAVNTLTSIGIPTSRISILNGPATSNSSLINKVASSTPIKDSPLNGVPQITLLTFKAAGIVIPSTILGNLSNKKLPVFIRQLKVLGFQDFLVTDINRTIWENEHTEVNKLFRADGTLIPFSFTATTNVISFEEILRLRIYVSNFRMSPKYNRIYSSLSEAQIIEEFNELIQTL